MYAPLSGWSIVNTVRREEKLWKTRLVSFIEPGAAKKPCWRVFSMTIAEPERDGNEFTLMPSRNIHK
jgi:hypothetical protein